MDSEDPYAYSLHLDLPHFTAIGTAYHQKDFFHFVRNVFGIKIELRRYTPEELAMKICSCCKEQNMSIDSESSIIISEKCKGFPKKAKVLLKRISDFAIVNNNGIIAKDLTLMALDLIESAGGLTC